MRQARSMFWLALLCVACLGCTNKSRETLPAPSVNKAAVVAEPPIPLDPAAPLPPELASQVAWRLAQQGDPMNLAVLAGQLGAARLAELIEPGGRTGCVALAAFEHAPDAHAERADLCALLPRLVPPHRQTGLASLERVYQQPVWGETLVPDADAACDSALTRLQQPPLSDVERDLIDSVRQRMRTKGDSVGR